MHCHFVAPLPRNDFLPPTPRPRKVGETTQERAEAVRPPETKGRTRKAHEKQEKQTSAKGKTRKEIWKDRARASSTHVGRRGAGSKARNDEARLEARIADTHSHGGPTTATPWPPPSPCGAVTVPATLPPLSSWSVGAGVMSLVHPDLGRKELRGVVREDMREDLGGLVREATTAATTPPPPPPLSPPATPPPLPSAASPPTGLLSTPTQVLLPPQS